MPNVYLLPKFVVTGITVDLDAAQWLDTHIDLGYKVFLADTSGHRTYRGMLCMVAASDERTASMVLRKKELTVEQELSKGDITYQAVDATIE